MLIRTALTTFLLVACVAACDDDTGVEEMAGLRVVHAAPGAPPIDVVLDPRTRTDPIVTGLAYGQASPFVDVEPDTYRVIVRVSGSDTIVDETEVTIADKHDNVTLVATGFVDSTDPSNTFRLLPIFEDFSTVTANETAVRLVHASPDAPTVDVTIADTQPIQTATVERFGETGELAVPSNEMLQIVVASNGVPLTAFTTPSLPDRGHLLVIAIGNVSDLPRVSTGFSLLVVAPDGVVTTLRQNPTVYALHASPDAPAVDIHAGATGPVLVADLSFGELASVQVPPGDYMLAFVPAGTSGAPVGSSNVVVLNPGERYLAVATGMLTPVDTEQRFQVGVFLEQFDLGTRPLLRAIHAVPDAPVVDISTETGNTLDTPPVFPELSFLEASPMQGTPVPSSPALRLGVAPARSTTPVATFVVNTTLVQRAFAVLGGALTPVAGEQGLRMFVIETATNPWTLTTVLPAQ